MASLRDSLAVALRVLLHLVGAPRAASLLLLCRRDCREPAEPGNLTGRTFPVCGTPAMYFSSATRESVLRRPNIAEAPELPP